MNSAPDVFDKARADAMRHGRHIIPQFFPGGTWRGKEYWIKNPMRADRSAGSFSISETGIFHDFADGTKGDLLDLLTRTRSLSKTEAAALIVHTAGEVPATATKTENKKALYIPAEYNPDDKLKDLEAHTSKKFIVEKYGKAAGVWDYRHNGRSWVVVVRHEKQGKKNIVPYYFTTAGKWTAGNPRKSRRPLYNVDKLALSKEPVIIHEGEKCSSLVIRGYISVTWIGGAAAVHKTDWAPLRGRRVIAWPDADEAGILAARAIKEILPHAEIIDIQGKPKGWDAADAHAEGLDLAAFIASCPRITSKQSKNIESVIGASIETPGMRYWNTIREHFLKRSREIDLTVYEMTEDDAARLYVDLFHEYFRYNKTINGFMVWTLTHWTPDTWQLAERAATLTAQFMQQNLAKMGADGLRDAAIFIKRLRSSTGVRAILFFAKSEPRITTTQEDYDKDVHLLNTPGGTVELVTGLMRPHRQSDLITKITRVTPDAHHTEKYFSDFLDEITLSRSDLKQALQRYFGAGCSGKNPKDKMALLFGSGSNGKTVLLESAAHCLGAYAATLDIKFLCSDEAFKSNSGHQDAIAQLAGVRFCSAIESKSGDRMNEGNVKRLTGGDGIPVSRKHEHTFTMYPAFQLFILTNHKPKIAGRDDGIWRRIELLPFDFKIPEERKDLDFKEKLLDADAPYIMAWLIDGCRKWYAGGYGSYQTTSAATKDYKQNEDTIGAFIDDCCTVDPGFSVQAGQLRTAYEKWAKDTGEYIFSGRAWRGALEERGFTRSHGRTGKRWAGLKVNEDENNDFV